MTAPTLAQHARTARRASVRRLPRIGLVTTVAMLVFVTLVVLSALASVLAPNDPLLIHSDAVLQAPSERFLLGTDDNGRDVFSRILFGMQNTMLIAGASVIIGSVLGMIIGLISGYARGPVDFFLQRGIEIVTAIPALVAAIVVVAVLGAGKWNIALAISIALIPPNARVMRATTMRVSSLMFCEAARAIGAGHRRIMFRHVLPNSIAPVLVVATANLSQAILAEASLGFLGLGVPPPEPSLGGMLSGAAQRFFYQAPWMAIFPGLAISLLVFCVNLLGDAIRDYLDPRLRWSL